jgi:hypothetical protein
MVVLMIFITSKHVPMALKDKGFWKTKITKVWNEEEKYKIH